MRHPAYVEAASNELAREVNRDVVLELIRSLQPTSRVDLARASGLQPSTVSSIVEQLLKEQWIRESAAVKTARGRRPSLLSLNDDLVVLVADVRPAQAIAALVDLSGRLLDRRVIPVSKDAGRSVEAIATAMNALRRMHPGKLVQGAGISLPGRIDPAGNQLIFSPNLQWQPYPIADRLRDLTGLEVQLENDANASLLAELWFGRIAGIRNAILLTVSEGIGAAILADGRLISGSHGMAGEFGHIAFDPEGPDCGCGAKGCWEVFASSSAALRFYQELCPDLPAPSMLSLIARALDDDVAARAALERQAHAIGKGLHLLNAVLSPEVIVLAGDAALCYAMSREVIEAECRLGAMDGVGPRLVSAGDGEVSRLRGAAAVVLLRHSGYYRAAHRKVEQR